jgi:hypothetical protein
MTSLAAHSNLAAMLPQLLLLLLLLLQMICGIQCASEGFCKHE